MRAPGRAATALALATVPVLAFASPAAAADYDRSAHATKVLTFSFKGEEITCTFDAATWYGYSEAHGNTQIAAENEFVTSPKCIDAVLETQAYTTWRNEGGREERMNGVSRGERVYTSTITEGEVTQVSTTHYLTYQCGNNVCYDNIVLSPK